METFDGENFAMCGKTIGSFRRNVLSFLVDMLWARGYKTNYHRSDNLLEIRRRGVVNYFYIFGGKDERSQDLIRGLTLAGLLCDEVALMPESFVSQATSRCSVEGSKFWFNCNPEGPLHWFKLEWIDKAAVKNLVYLHFTMDDNQSLSDKIKERYRAMYSGVFKKRFIDGLWAIAAGLIYDMFDKDRHVIAAPAADELNPNAGRYVSCDYGTQNPTVFKLWEKLVTGQWVCTKEYYHSGRVSGAQKTDSQYADDLEAFMMGKEDKTIDYEYVIIDPSAASFMAELKARGIRIKRANNEVLNGIRLVSTLLTLGQILYVDVCEKTIEEYGMYAWDEKACARGEDAPVKEADHCMDADRYFVNTVIRKERKWRDAA